MQLWIWLKMKRGEFPEGHIQGLTNERACTMWKTLVPMKPMKARYVNMEPTVIKHCINTFK